MREKKKTIYRCDYQGPAYLVETIDLSFHLGEDFTLVESSMILKRDGQAPEGSPLYLFGRELELQSLKLDGREVGADSYLLDDEGMLIHDAPEHLRLDIVTKIRPQENSSLEGLYRSSGIFCTQCEAEGFRKITYYPDRPDVMALFTCTITADRKLYPVLLSNGNLVDSGDLEGDRHFARWEDPFPKPSYLFALVAGDLVRAEDRFTTSSGREVALHIYVEERNRDKCAHAMESLKKSMKWDEEVFGLEYDLEIYMILAVDDFNMGAMENKGLNIFNSKYVLASPDTATDADYWAIEEVIGHEYFHNWTGNRVTCRDWFQLSLKEGLTVFRDQEFSADMTSRPVKRIQDVRILRNAQFPEDAGPMAHNVRPDSYEEINNFYTSTVYNKGAEVIRMMHTLLGREAFRKGMDLYFKRHDGQAVTCDDFVAAMEDASAVDLKQFRLWYSQAGTPELAVKEHYNEEAGLYSLTFRQTCPPSPGQEKKEPFHIPMAMGLLDKQGRDRPLRLEGEKSPDDKAQDMITRVLDLKEEEEIFYFTGIFHRPVPSLLRGFSAPVKLRFDYSDEDLAFLMANDSDSFNRWEAGQKLSMRIILRLIEDIHSGADLTIPPSFIEAFGKTLKDDKADKALLAQALLLPAEAYIAEQMAVVDPDAIRGAREFLRKGLALTLQAEFMKVYRDCCHDGPYETDPLSVGRRSMKNLCLSYLMAAGDVNAVRLCMGQFESANNMTDVISALGPLSNHESPEREKALSLFYAKWEKDPLVIDKWFTIQAGSTLPDTLERVKDLVGHKAFNIKNPNRVRALIGAFSQGNMAAFHRPDGAGYVFLADSVIELDRFNPQVAARMVAALSRWRRYDPARQALMKGELERIGSQPGLSANVAEIVGKSLC